MTIMIKTVGHTPLFSQGYILQICSKGQDFVAKKNSTKGLRLIRSNTVYKSWNFPLKHVCLFYPAIMPEMIKKQTHLGYVEMLSCGR